MILLEEAHPLRFCQRIPLQRKQRCGAYNPLGKVPALVTDDGECWFDSQSFARYLELLGVAPPMIPADPRAALRMRS
ncbi:glutathione S-transferase N-terminal domain-containing protein [Klebsiella pneumoniae]|nr:glutathione S-transferase N-terminal domain-containing protein [Klebsiella pneumoniae]